MTTATLPNGVVGTSSYDNANRLTGISYVKGGTTLASASYTLDAVGNRTARTDLAGTQTYAYDNAYRLTSVTYPGPSTTTYAYDAFGNRTSTTSSAGTTTTAYNDASEIMSVTPPSPAPAVSYTYDANGNVTNRGSDSFSWDYENRMAAATVGGTNYSYTYRGDGLRNSATTGGATTTFTWDINAGLPVLLDDGSQYIYGNGLIAQVSGANTSYYLSDGLGSVLATTDASGNVVNAYTYDVYGKTTASSGSQPNSFQFAGQQTDSTGLQYLRARYYDPSSGSFLSRDPLSAIPGWQENPFGYAGANPATMRDPRSLAECPPGWNCPIGPDGGMEPGDGGPGYIPPIGDQVGPTFEPGGIAIDGVLVPEPLTNEYDGFANGARLQDHFGRHGGDFGAQTAEDYGQMANRFVRGDSPGTTGFIRLNGERVLWNSTTREFAVVSGDGVIETYFQPKQPGNAYYYEQLVTALLGGYSDINER